MEIGNWKKIDQKDDMIKGNINSINILILYKPITLSLPLQLLYLKPMD